jgi:hypothetical protein
VPARASQLVFGLSHFLPNDVVAVSSSDTNEALKFLMLELECSDSPRPVQTNVQGTSSESSMGSEWFEDWPEANNMVARFYVNLSMESSPSCLRPWSSFMLFPRSAMCSHLKNFIYVL